MGSNTKPEIESEIKVSNEKGRGNLTVKQQVLPTAAKP
jgi:hypothetical protein